MERNRISGYIATLLAFILATPGAFAQMDNVVEVETSYRPKVKDAKKIDVLPDLEETQPRHMDIKYETTTVPVENYTFTPMSVTHSDDQTEAARSGFATVAGGTNANMLMRAAYGLKLNPSNIVNMDFSLRGYNKTIDNCEESMGKWKSRSFLTNLGLNYEHRFASEASLIVGANYKSHTFNYQPGLTQKMDGVVFTDFDKQTSSFLDLSAQLTPVTFGDLYARLRIDYSHFGQKHPYGMIKSVQSIPGALYPHYEYENYNLKENYFKASADLGWNINDNLKLSLDIDFHTGGFTPSWMKTHTRLHALPRLAWHNDDLAISVGAFLETNGNIAPDIRASYTWKKDFSVYLEATGGEVLNDARHLAQMSPYFSMHNLYNPNATVDIDDQFDQLRAKAGIRFKPFRGLYLDLGAGYDISKNRAELMTHQSSPNHAFDSFDIGRMSVGFADGHRFYIDLNGKYAYKDIFNANANWTINNWETDLYDDSKETLIWRPATSIDIDATVRIVKGLRFGMDFLLQSYRKCEGERLRPTCADLGANISYTFGRIYTVYVEGNNLFNSSYDQYYRYRALPRSASLGFKVTF